MHKNSKPEKRRQSSNLTRIFSVTDWRKYQLSRVVQSPLMSDLEKVNAGYMLRAQKYADFEIVMLSLTRIVREKRAAADFRVGVAPHA